MSHSMAAIRMCMVQLDCARCSTWVQDLNDDTLFLVVHRQTLDLTAMRRTLCLNTLR